MTDRTRHRPRAGALVSVVVPFYNTPASFMREAVDSILAQDHPTCELLLVDDGSTGESTALALEFARQHSHVRYLEHPHHENRGISASRMLGVANAVGSYVAFLDSDDVWLPTKLTDQVALMEQHPEAGMVYGNTEYWYSWTGNPDDRPHDFMPRLGVTTDKVMQPPTLVPLFLSGEAAVPCTCSILVRRDIFDSVGGFETSFRSMYEDQVFYSKVCLAAPVLVSERCWDRYRQHPDSICAAAEREGQEAGARNTYLRWLETYLEEQGIDDREVWRALRESRRRLDGEPLGEVRRRVRKWLKRLVR
jgi:cellulose synthase/poly-beta-1,6-N-acetylglucosamine synthase-like glycosyltransferase